MSTLRLTAQLTDALARFCDDELLACHVRALDKMEDVLLGTLSQDNAMEVLGNITTLRETRELLTMLLEAMEEEGGVE